MEETIHIQSIEAREKTINRFCKLTAASALPSVFIYIYLKIYLLAAVCGIIGLLFVLFVYLNNNKQSKISRVAIILTTNFGVLFFSMYLGYDSGIYLYLFVAPLLIYLLYDFNDKKITFSFLALYLITFIIIFFNPKPFFSISDKLNPSIIEFIYSFNFCSAFILCFGLITYFANNNYRYIANINKQRSLLEQEVSLRNKSEELLRKSLNEREVLLAEIHHRVKNNLAIISALINLQKDNLKDNASKQMFDETRNRIYAMSLIHNLLYQNNSFAKIDFSEYVKKFCENLTSSFDIKTNISFEQKIENVSMDLKVAVPLGLILNELVTNSIKHAFKNQDHGKITIGLMWLNDDQYKFWVSDSGVGIEDAALVSGNSMGMGIVTSLVEQIEGTLSYERNNGSTFTIILTIPKNLS